MARITIEDCLDHVDNMYELVLLATRRSRQIIRGDTPLVRSKNKINVIALREIAAGKVKAIYQTPDKADAAELNALMN